MVFGNLTMSQKDHPLQKNDSTHPFMGLLRLPKVLEIIPVSRSSWWAGIKNGRYPAPVKLSARSVAWKGEDIKALLDSLTPA